MHLPLSFTTLHTLTDLRKYASAEYIPVKLMNISREVAEQDRTYVDISNVKDFEQLWNDVLTEELLRQKWINGSLCVSWSVVS